MSLTIYDISKAAGVSTATVSRVLNGNSNVKESTRLKVLDIIEKSGYTPNAFAQGMSSQTTKTIGILCADSSDIFLAKAIYLLQQELQLKGYESLLCCTGYNFDKKRNYANLILSKKVDALILVGSNFIGTTEEENKYIVEAANQLPVMVLNADFDHDNVYSTFCDDRKTVKETTKKMMSSGIKDVIYLYCSDSYSSRHKLMGFRDALADENIDDYESRTLYYTGDFSQMNSIADAIADFAAKGNSFHGIITSDDSLAIGAVKYAQRAGLSIPDDLAIIGFNNSILTTCCTPELTSVDNRLEALTHQLVGTLLSVLAGEEVPRHSVFNGRLVERGTFILKKD